MTYFYLNLAFTLFAVLLDFAILKTRCFTEKKLWLLCCALLLLTAVFDNVLVGFGIVQYDPDRITGLRIGHAPVEDFFYSFLLSFLAPAIWRYYAKTPETARGTENISSDILD